MMGGGLLFYRMRLATGSFLVGRVSGFCGVVKVSSYGLDLGVCELSMKSVPKRPGVRNEFLACRWLPESGFGPTQRLL